MSSFENKIADIFNKPNNNLFVEIDVYKIYALGLGFNFVKLKNVINNDNDDNISSFEDLIQIKNDENLVNVEENHIQSNE